MMKFKYLNNYLVDLLKTSWTYFAFLPALYEISSFYFKSEYLPELPANFLYIVGALIFAIANYTVYSKNKREIAELDQEITALKSNEVSYKLIAHTYKNTFENERAKIVEAKQKIESKTSNQVILVHNALGGITNKTWDEYQKDVKKYEEEINLLLNLESWIVRLDLQIKNVGNTSDSSVRVTVRTVSDKVKFIDSEVVKVSEFPSEPRVGFNLRENYLFPSIDVANFNNAKVRDFYVNNESCVEVKLYEILVGESVNVMNNSFICESEVETDFEIEVEIKSEKTREPIIKRIVLEPKSTTEKTVEI